MSKEPSLEEILNKRQEEYGDALQNFERIGKIWGALLDREPIQAYQVALMMDSLKTVRAFNNPEHQDSWIDKLGYIKHAVEILNK
jgi:hypothetical protein